MAATKHNLPDELRKRIAKLVEGTGRTAHGFMVEAIELAAETAVLRARFGAEALKAEVEASHTGKAYVATEVFDYLAAKSQGGKASRPRPKAWRP